MKVSVVIPAYNEEKYLGKCLESLQNQTEKPFEIIVVDNNSGDKTATIAKKMGARVITEKQQGISFSRNAGFDAVKGDIIARIDADTIAPNNWLEKITKDIEKDNYDVVYGPAYYMNLPKQIQISHVPTIVFFETVNALWKHHMLLGLNMALKKSVWEKVRNEVCMDNTLVHEDLDIGIHLWKYKVKIKFDKSLIVNSSIRRFKNPASQLEYTQRFFKTLSAHDLIHIPHPHL
jgi:glycosyltransferase involved in cell wall biosynthesis